MSDDKLEGFWWDVDWRLLGIHGKVATRTKFRDYISAIIDFEDVQFDPIDIDGKEWVGCLLHAVPKLKQGGEMLILDDFNRQEYSPFFTLLCEWSVKRFTFWFA